MKIIEHGVFYVTNCFFSNSDVNINYLMISFQITNGGFTTEDDISPSDPYDTNTFKKDRIRKNDATSSKDDYSSLTSCYLNINKL